MACRCRLLRGPTSGEWLQPRELNTQWQRLHWCILWRRDLDITTMRTALLPIILVFVGGGYPQNSEMTESKPEYPILRPGDVAKVPVILEGLVIADGVPEAPPQNSPLDGRPVQLW